MDSVGQPTDQPTSSPTPVEPIYFWGKVKPDGKISSYAALRRDIRNLTVYQRKTGWRIVRLVLVEDLDA